MKRYRKKPEMVAQLQQEIKERKHPLVWMADSFHDGVHLIDPYQKRFPILYVNHGFTEMTGFQNTEMVGREQSALEGADTDPNASRKVKEAIEYEQGATIEILNYRKDGTPFWKELHINSLYSPEGELYAFIGIQKDITHKKKMGRQELNTPRSFQSTYGCDSNMVTFINPNGITEKISSKTPGLKKVEEKSIGNYITDSVVAEDREKVMRSFRSALKGRTENLTIRCVHCNHDAVELDLLYIPSFVNYRVNGVYAIYKNKTGSNQTSELINNAEKYRTISMMASGIAQEIRYPLTSLKGFVQLLRPSLHEKQTYSDVMLAEIERIEQVMTELSLLSRPHVIAFAKLNLHTILKHVCTLLYTSTVLNNIKIDLTYNADAKQICGDKNRLKQAFINLLKNAIEAMPAGGGTIRIDVTDRNDASVCIRVKDNGEGIAAENLEEIEQPFYTTRKEGTGLGIMICKNIIRDHQGSLTFKSPENYGTTVEVILPTIEAQ